LAVLVAVDHRVFHSPSTTCSIIEYDDEAVPVVICADYCGRRMETNASDSNVPTLFGIPTSWQHDVHFSFANTEDL
jgi:hypothetical protein